MLIDNDSICLYEIKYSKQSLDEHSRNIINKDFITELEQVYNKKAASYNILYRGNTLTKEVNPVDVFSNLAESSIRANTKEKWQQLKARATQFNWQPTPVNYINITDFLSSI